VVAGGDQLADIHRVRVQLFQAKVAAGLGAAIFVSEFCGQRARETLKIVIELLAAIPSVVWGFVGYMVLNPVLIWATAIARNRRSGSSSTRSPQPAG